MANVIIPPGWRIPDREATPESIYHNRRAFLKQAGLGLAAAGLSACGTDFTPIPIDNQIPDGSCDASPPPHPLSTICPSPTLDLYPANRNSAYDVPARDLTDRLVAATYNNFYEFIGGGLGGENTIWPYVGPFTVWPWTVEIAGEAELTGTFDVSDLEREFGLEERVYRHRCVERWSMVVPWTGYPLARLIQKFRPLSSANYVRFVGFNRPNEAVGQRVPGIYPWPYYEALRMDEATNELAFVVTGIFGEPLPKQHGAPWRLALPWKYGFKGPKSIVRIEFTQEQPPTFWPDVWSDEYGFYSNVNPDVAHPRWSQQWETPIGTEEQRATTLFNGYASYVADLYDAELLTYIS